MLDNLTIKELLELNHLTEVMARYQGLLSKCPRCGQEIIRHPNPALATCLIELAKTQDPAYDYEKIKKALVKEFSNGK